GAEGADGVESVERNERAAISTLPRPAELCFEPTHRHRGKVVADEDRERLEIRRGQAADAAGEQDASPDSSRGSRTEGRFEVLTSARCPTATVKAPPHLPERPHEDRHSREAVPQERTTLNPDDARQDLDLPVVGSKQGGGLAGVGPQENVAHQRLTPWQPPDDQVPCPQRGWIHRLDDQTVSALDEGPETSTEPAEFQGLAGDETAEYRGKPSGVPAPEPCPRLTRAIAPAGRHSHALERSMSTIALPAVGAFRPVTLPVRPSFNAAATQTSASRAVAPDAR